MDVRLIQVICQEIYRRYPYLNGCRPRIQPVPPAAGKPPACAGQPAHLLVFKSQGLTADRRSITNLVRVVVDQNGKILKISTSR